MALEIIVSIAGIVLILIFCRAVGLFERDVTAPKRVVLFGHHDAKPLPNPDVEVVRDSEEFLKSIGEDHL